MRVKDLLAQLPRLTDAHPSDSSHDLSSVFSDLKQRGLVASLALAGVSLESPGRGAGYRH